MQPETDVAVLVEYMYLPAQEQYSFGSLSEGQFQRHRRATREHIRESIRHLQHTEASIGEEPAPEATWFSDDIFQLERQPSSVPLEFRTQSCLLGDFVTPPIEIF